MIFWIDILLYIHCNQASDIFLLLWQWNPLTNNHGYTRSWPGSSSTVKVNLPLPRLATSHRSLLRAALSFPLGDQTLVRTVHVVSLVRDGLRFVHDAFFVVSDSFQSVMENVEVKILLSPTPTPRHTHKHTTERERERERERENDNLHYE